MNDKEILALAAFLLGMLIQYAITDKNVRKALKMPSFGKNKQQQKPQNNQQQKKSQKPNNNNFKKK